MSNTLDDIYNQITKSEEDKKAAGSRVNKDLLRPQPGHTYLVRLVPYMPDVSKTFVSFGLHDWNSTSNGRYVNAGACPKSIGGGPCKICEEGYAAYERKLQHKGELKSKLLLPRTSHLVNVYVIEDSADANNNGTVKVLKYGSVLNTLIYDNVLGDDREEVGKAAFDLSKNGITLKIVVSRKGGDDNNKKALPTYEKSKFVTAGKINLTKAEQDAVYAQAFDLTALIPKTESDEKIDQLLAVHFHGEDNRPIGNSDNGDDDDDDVTNDSVADSKAHLTKVEDLLASMDDDD